MPANCYFRNNHLFSYLCIVHFILLVRTIKSFFISAFIFTSYSCFSITDSTSTPDQLLSKLLQFKSLSGQEKPMGVFLERECRKMGLVTHVFSDTDTSFNFSASVFSLEFKLPNIVMLNHMDVVPALQDSQWRYSPFSGTIVNDTVWGRGALDTKGMAVMQLFAVKKMAELSKQREINYNYTVLFVSDEERGGKNGGKIITEKFMDLLNPVLVLGEGGAGLTHVLPSKPDQLLFFTSITEKQSLWLKLEVKMKSSGHGAIFSTDNANQVLLRTMFRLEKRSTVILMDDFSKKMFKEIGTLNGGIKGFILKNINTWLLRPFRKKILSQEPWLINSVTNTYQLTSWYNPETPPNQIPTYAAAYYDCRLLPGITTEKFLKILKRKIRDRRVIIKIIDESPEAKIIADEKFLPVLQHRIQQIFENCEQLQVMSPASSDNSYFRSCGIPSYGIMPIELNEKLIGTIHGINERIAVIQLKDGISNYFQLLYAVNAIPK